MIRRQQITQEQKDPQLQVQCATRSQTVKMKQNSSITQTKEEGNQVRNNSEDMEPLLRKQVKTGATKRSVMADLNEKSVLEALISLKDNDANVPYKKLNESIQTKCNIDAKKQKEQINKVLHSLQRNFLIVQQKTFIHINNEEEIQLDRGKGDLLNEEDNLSVVPDQVPTQVYNLNQFKQFLRQESRQVIIQTSMKYQDYQNLFSRKPIIKEMNFQWDINAVENELYLFNSAVISAKIQKQQFGSREGKLIKLSIDGSQIRKGFTQKKYNRFRLVLVDKHVILLQQSVFAFSRLRYLSMSIYSHQGNEETQNAIYQFLISVPLNLVVLTQFKFLCQQSTFAYLLDTLKEIEKNEKLALSEPFEELSIIFKDKKVERVNQIISETQGLQSQNNSFHSHCSYNLIIYQDQLVCVQENHDNKQFKLIQERATQIKELQCEIRIVKSNTDDCKAILDTLSNAHAIRKVKIKYDNLFNSLSHSYPCLAKDYPELNYIEICQIFQISELGSTTEQRQKKVQEEFLKILDRHSDHVISLRRQLVFHLCYRIGSQTSEYYVNHRYELSSTEKRQYLEIDILQVTYLKPLRRLLLEMFAFTGFFNSIVFCCRGNDVAQQLLTLFIDVLGRTQQLMKIDLSLWFSIKLQNTTRQLIKNLIVSASNKCQGFTLNLSRTPDQFLIPYIKYWLSELRYVNANNFVLEIKFGQRVWATLSLSEIKNFLILIMFLKFTLTVDLQQSPNYFLQNVNESFNRMKQTFLSVIHQNKTILQLKLMRKLLLIKANKCEDVLTNLKPNRCFYRDVINSQI